MKMTILAAAFGAFFALEAQAACTYPVAPGTFPDGSVASLEEMQGAKKVVTKYDADITAYLECIKTEYETQSAASTDEKQKADLSRAYDQKDQAARTEVTEVVERFNEQLRAWKAKNGADKKKS